MTAFLAELGTKLADRWLQALLLPGLLWTAALAGAVELGQSHPFQVERLSNALDRLAARPAAHAPGTVILAAAAILPAGAAVGLVAGALGNLVQILWVLPGNLPPASWLLAWRRRRWNNAAHALASAIRAAVALDGGPTGAKRTGVIRDPRTQPTEMELAEARVRSEQRRLARKGTEVPAHPTRIGDRFAEAGTHIATINGLANLKKAWPRLWSVLPDTLRTDITAARTAYTATARLVGWGLLYALLAGFWWPAALIGAAILAAAAVRARGAANVLADLIETATDLHTPDLAKLLGLPTAGPLCTGQAITARLAGAVGETRTIAEES